MARPLCLLKASSRSWKKANFLELGGDCLAQIRILSPNPACVTEAINMALSSLGLPNLIHSDVH